MIRTEPEVPDAERLLQIHREVGALLKNSPAGREIAIEELFFNKNSRRVLAVSQARRDACRSPGRPAGGGDIHLSR